VIKTRAHEWNMSFFFIVNFIFYFRMEKNPALSVREGAG